MISILFSHFLGHKWIISGHFFFLFKKSYHYTHFSDEHLFGQVLWSLETLFLSLGNASTKSPLEIFLPVWRWRSRCQEYFWRIILFGILLLAGCTCYTNGMPLMGPRIPPSWDAVSLEQHRNVSFALDHQAWWGALYSLGLSEFQ